MIFAELVLAWILLPQKYSRCNACLINHVTENLDNLIETSLLLRDVAKAFEFIDLDTFFFKLQCYGCSNFANNWFRSYLANYT